MGDRHFQTSFSSGEIDEGLQERVDLKAYQAGLNTARNVNITKRGTIVSRAGRKYIEDIDFTHDNVKLFTLTDDLFLATIYGNPGFGEYLYYYVYDSDGNILDSTPSVLTDTVDTNATMQAEVRKIEDGKLFVTLNSRNRDLLADLEIDIATGAIDNENVDFYSLGTLILSNTLASSSFTGTGYGVDYIIKGVRDGEELPMRTITGNSLPVSVSERNDFQITCTNLLVTEIRVYRRPSDGGAYGFIGSSYVNDKNADPIVFDFTDFGQDADFTHSPPLEIEDTTNSTNSKNFNFKDFLAIETYQNKFLVTVDDAIYSSRTDIHTNLHRDFPYNDVSALSFKPSSTGSSILSLKDYNGLLIFTKKGLFYHSGVLGPENLNCTYQGPWRVDDLLAPVEIPGALLFVDASTNVVRELNFDEGVQRIVAPEVSIFSDHLFAENRITSWAFQDGELPLLHATFSDGTYATFTYQQEHKMRAWTRCDSANNVEQVIAVPNSSTGRFEADVIFLCVDDSGDYTFEKSVQRYLKPQEIVSNPEADKGPVIAAMDSMVSWSHLILDDLTDDDMVLTPVVADTWDGDLTLSVTDDAIFPDPGIGAVGTYFKWFNPDDRTEILLEVTARTDDDTITVTPSREFPSAYATNPRLYEAKTNFTGLDHMEGESVAVVADGYVIASPNNNIENYDAQTVSSGEIDLDEPYCIVHIGRPHTCDVETLAITEVGQGRGLQYSRLESFTCNRVFIRVKDTRGLYVGNRFPADDLVEGDDVTGTNQIALDGFSSYDVNYEAQNAIVGNRYDQPYTRTIEITTPGDFDGLGKIAIRQVDPVHFEILSITPDIEIVK